MKIAAEQLGEAAENALRTCLEPVPFLNIRQVRKQVRFGNIGPDLLFVIEVSGSQQRQMVVEAKNNGQPRVAREAVGQLLRYREVLPEAYGVFVAPYISSEAAAICTDEDVGYIDLSGNCRICFDSVYIERAGRPNKFARKQDLRSLYSPKAERVLRVLLMNPGKSWKMQSLADEAEVSLGQASNVKKLLGDREWIRATPKGFVFEAFERLLAEWSDNYSFRKNKVKDFYSLEKIPEIEAALAEVCGRRNIKYALTGFSGAARLAPMVRYTRSFAYVAEVTQDLISAMDLQEVSSGSNLSLLIPYDEGVFYGRQKVEGIQIAAPIQVYLDVISYSGRGEEAAEALLREVIRPSW